MRHLIVPDTLGRVACLHECAAAYGAGTKPFQAIGQEGGDHVVFALVLLPEIYWRCIYLLRWCVCVCVCWGGGGGGGRWCFKRAAPFLKSDGMQPDKRKACS